MSRFTAANGYDVRERCQRFDMTALNEADQIFLAALYRVLYISGGQVEIRERSAESGTMFRIPSRTRQTTK